MALRPGEWDAAKGDRDGVEVGDRPDGDGCGAYVKVDGVCVYEDGGESEDLIVCRDLWPLVIALRALAAERNALREKVSLHENRHDAFVRDLSALREAVRCADAMVGLECHASAYRDAWAAYEAARAKVTL